MRLRFKKDEVFTIGQPVEWQNVSHWLPGEIVGPIEKDGFGTPYYSVRNLKATRTVSKGERLKAYPGKLRRRP